jgi:hypothetical protein
VKLYNGMEKPSNLFSRSSDGLSGMAGSGSPCSKWDKLGSAKASSNELEKRLSVGCPRPVEGPKVRSSALEECQNGVRLSTIRLIL